MNTKQRGSVTEAKALARLMERGKHVLVPFSNVGRYDLLIDNRDGTFSRVECKTGCFRRGGIVFKTASTGGYNRAGESSHYDADADLFGVWYPGNDRVYLVPVNGAPRSWMQLRLDEPKAPGNLSGVRWARDYEL